MTETREKKINNKVFTKNDIKKIESINFEYRSFLKEYKRITIELTHGNSNYRNILTVKGDEGLWVAGTFNKFEILLNSVKPQNNWFVNYQTSILILSTFFLSNVLLKIIFPFLLSLIPFLN